MKTKVYCNSSAVYFHTLYAAVHVIQILIIFYLLFKYIDFQIQVKSVYCEDNLNSLVKKRVLIVYLHWCCRVLQCSLFTKVCEDEKLQQ